MKVNLGVVLDAIETADDSFTYFLDTETGKSVFLADELITGLDTEGLEEEIEEHPGRYLPLPTRFDIHEYHIMETFVWDLPAGGRRDALEAAIRGGKAFRRFKDAVRRFGMEQEWYRYEAGAYRKIAVDWCVERGIEYDE